MNLCRFRCKQDWPWNLIFVKILTGTSIGRRYARTDELGVPFAITVDSTTSVTIRERDSKDQVRVDVEKAADVIREVTEGQRTWEDVWSTFPHHSSTATDDWRPILQSWLIFHGFLLQLFLWCFINESDYSDITN
jgi:hypothetical protein